MAQVTIPIGGMTCNHCVQSVKNKLSGMAGVSAVDVDLAKGQAVVTGDDLDVKAMCTAIDDMGFEAGTVAG